MNEQSFDDLMFPPVSAEDVVRSREPRHLSRSDLRRWHRNAWLREFDTQLAIGGLVAAGIVVALCVLGIIASAVAR